MKVIRIDVIRRRLEDAGITYYSMFGVRDWIRREEGESVKRIHAETIALAVAAEAWRVLKGEEQLAGCWRNCNG